MTSRPSPPLVEPGAASTKRVLRILSLNIQLGLSSTRYRHYVTQAWRHVLPSRGVTATLECIAKLVCNYDVVALQEADAGSLRTSGLNQVRYLAAQAGFEHWQAAVNRDIGPFAQHCLGCLSQLPLGIVRHHRLPGRVRGRGALEVELHPAGCDPLRLIVTHLSLGRKSRTLQLAYLAALTHTHPQTIIIGDFNCETQELQAHADIAAAGLRVLESAPTYPSWSPRQTIDHMLVTPGIETGHADVLDMQLSDHLPVAVEIALRPRRAA